MSAQLDVFGESRAEAERLMNMRMPMFMASGASIEIFSEFLPGEIWFVADRGLAEKLREERPEAVTYTGRELDEIHRSGIGREELKVINNIKQIFRGRLVGFRAKKK